MAADEKEIGLLLYGIKSKAAVSLTFNYTVKQIAALFYTFYIAYL